VNFAGWTPMIDTSGDIHTTMDPVLPEFKQNNCIDILVQMNGSPLIKSKVYGSIACISDFPYPVRRGTKVSFPCRKDIMASFCLFF